MLPLPGVLENRRSLRGVCVDCPLRNSEAQSGSAGVPRPAAVDAIETIEHAGCVFGRNTWSANARADSNETLGLLIHDEMHCR